MAGIETFRLEAGDVVVEFDSLTLGTGNAVIESTILVDGQTVLVKNPGRLQLDEVVISRPLDGNLSLWNWRTMVESGDIVSARRNFEIAALDGEGSELCRWSIEAGWPAAIAGERLPDGSFREVLTIAIEKLTRVELSLPNNPPVIDLPASFSIAVGETANFTVTSTDPDGDIVALSLLLAPAGATFEDGVFNWTVPLGAIDTLNDVTFQADDQRGEPNSTTTDGLTITVPRDFDGNLIDDDWEVIWFGSIGIDPSLDTDSDGERDGEEFQSGTNPVNPGSVLRIIEIGIEGSTTAILFIAQPGITYRLLYNDNGFSAGSWQQAGAVYLHDQPAPASHFLFDETRPLNGKRFYRLDARRP